MDLTASMRHRDCPVCRGPAGNAVLFMRNSLDVSRLTAASFASRKTPEFMSYRLVRCAACATVFASEAPTASALANAYHQADYSTAAEASLAAMVYRNSLEPFLAELPRRETALEIGAGTGVFLGHLKELGFREPIGIEPSPAAIAAVPAAVRPSIREGVFTGDEFPPESLSLVCCFQTLEHVPEPLDLVEAAFRMLQPGGMIALVTHDYTAPINRMLGRRSPIIDIEHVQLFCPQSLRYLVCSAGYRLTDIVPIRNVYPLNYWLSLLPLPAGLKRFTLASARAIHLSQRNIGLYVGNVLTVARKPN
ncbi:MAG TPA: class I SAM-dependent methyltransferase [Stellaceae bacterium]|jgi:SAM-dependent methyltransferase|nr:class I SAM-dependent methyltransferase [Stellaceae bacterium]